MTKEELIQYVKAIDKEGLLFVDICVTGSEEDVKSIAGMTQLGVPVFVHNDSVKVEPIYDKKRAEEILS
jgi:hypothetical protein